MSVLVAGSLHLDVVVRAPRLPASDETLMGDGVDYVCGGKGGNQAVAAARMGAVTHMAGKVGDDIFAPILVENLKSAGVGISVIQHGTGERSGMSAAIVEHSGDYGAVVVSAANKTIDVGEIMLPPDLRVLVLQNEIPESVNRQVAELAKGAGANVVLNAAPMRTMDPQVLALCDVLIVNRVEASALFGRPCENRQNALEIAAHARGFSSLVITLGGDGVVLRSGTDAARHFPAYPVSVHSTHGAGDTFAGALAARLDAGDSVEAALPFAQAAAALLVSTSLENRHLLDAKAVLKFMET
ncbi:MAG TPA: ribokinase [Rhizobiaceae bacterium]|nr:ribokinase [Rhizobiaceae bacterium]